MGMEEGMPQGRDARPLDSQNYGAVEVEMPGESANVRRSGLAIRWPILAGMAAFALVGAQFSGAAMPAGATLASAIGWNPDGVSDGTDGGSRPAFNASSHHDGDGYEVITALGEFYFTAAAMDDDGDMTTSLMQYLPEKGVTIIDALSTDGLKPLYCTVVSKKIFVTTATHGIWAVDEETWSASKFLSLDSGAEPLGIIADYEQEYLYFVERANDAVYRVSASNSSDLIKICTVPSPYDIVLKMGNGQGNSYIYVTSTEGYIYRSLLDGSGLTKLVDAAGAKGITISGNSTVYWVGSDSVYSARLPDIDDVKTLATGFSSLIDIQAQRNGEPSLFVSDVTTDSIYSMGIHGSHPKVVVSASTPRGLCFPTTPSPPSPQPSALPTPVPSSLPTSVPSPNPTISQMPSSAPPTYSPSAAPTYEPSSYPTEHIRPTPKPTLTDEPTQTPSAVPSPAPTYPPTPAPSFQPTFKPSAEPSAVPTSLPTIPPTYAPTQVPTPKPTRRPTPVPTSSPTISPSYAPTSLPTYHPTTPPTPNPSQTPSYTPTGPPTKAPTTTVYASEMCEDDEYWLLEVGQWDWDWYWNNTCFVKLGGVSDTEIVANNQMWISPTKYADASYWRNVIYTAKVVLPTKDAQFWAYTRLQDMGKTELDIYGYGCRYGSSELLIEKAHGHNTTKLVSKTIETLQKNVEYKIQLIAREGLLKCGIWTRDGAKMGDVETTSWLYTVGSVGLRTDSAVFINDVNVQAWQDPGEDPSRNRLLL